jgi:hypothetical protein
MPSAATNGVSVVIPVKAKWDDEFTTSFTTGARNYSMFTKISDL